MGTNWDFVAKAAEEPADLKGLSGLDRFLAVMRRKPGDWVPGGWYDPEVGISTSCQLGRHVDLCARICSCGCHAQRIRESQAIPKPKARCGSCGRTDHTFAEGEPKHDLDLPLGWALSPKAAALAYR